MKSYKFKILILLALGICAIFPSILAAQEQPARFHHVRLNVTDTKASVAYYKKFFSAVPIRFRGVSDALLTDRSYILFNTVSKPAPINARTGLWHIGWGGIDGQSEYKWRTGQGIKWQRDIVTVGKDAAYFMYASGPDREIVEVWTGTPYQRYNHIHLLAEDPNITRDWYIDNLGAKGKKDYIPNPNPPPAGMTFGDPPEKVFSDGIWNTSAQIDGVIFNIFGKPDKPVFWWEGKPIDEFEKTDGHVIDHFAFSYPDIGPVYKRMKADGVEIVRRITQNDKLKMKSFFVRAPDGVLVEIVEADPLPDASWLRHVR